MKQLICSKCHNAILFNDSLEIVQCNVCGTRFRVKVKGTDGSQQSKGDCVQQVKAADGRYAGLPVVQAYVPKDWVCQAQVKGVETNIFNPLLLSLVFTNNKGEFINYIPELVYNNDPNMIQPCVTHPSLMVSMRYNSAVDVCNGMIANSDVREIYFTDKVDEDTEKLANRICSLYTNTINPGWEWCEVVFENADKYVITESLVTHVYIPVNPVEMQMYNLLMQSRRPLMSLGMLPPVNPPQPQLRWCIYYKIIGSFNKENIEFGRQTIRKIRDSYKMVPEFEREFNRLRENALAQARQEDAIMGNAMAQMNRDRMRSWERQQNIIRSTNDEINDIMRETRENTSKSMDRVRNMQSESIRGVKTYRDTRHDRIVEADVGWDHVYAGRQEGDYAASKGQAPLDFGVDYEELEETKGDY